MSETIQLIRALKNSINKNPSEPQTDDYIDGEVSNRGNKLKQGASYLHRDQLKSSSAVPLVSTVFFDGEEREHIVRKKRLIEIDGDGEGPKRVKVEVDPYKDINITKILAPITRPEDAVTNKSIARIFQDDSLRYLAQQAIDTIEYEQNNSNALSNLMGVFLGEDPKYLKIDNMKLPDYNHNLADGETNEELKLKPEKHKNDYVIESSLENGSTNPVKAEEYLNSLQTNENKRITRGVDSNYQEVDPFFALPQMAPDPNDGLDDRFADEVRRLNQFTLQRNREYIRLLQKIRMDLIRAERLKDQVFKWCKEMAGDEDKA